MVTFLLVAKTLKVYGNSIWMIVKLNHSDSKFSQSKKKQFRQFMPKYKKRYTQLTKSIQLRKILTGPIA